MIERDRWGTDYVSAVFDDRGDAERAIAWLRENGVPDDNISVVARHDDTAVAARHPSEEAAARETATGAGKGLAAGAGVGALFGLAAAAIPGIGPFITAGWLATTLGAAGGGAAAGALVGGTAGALAGALANAGIPREHAEAYAGHLERGGTLLAVDIRGIALDRADVEGAFRRFNGRFYEGQA